MGSERQTSQQTQQAEPTPEETRLNELEIERQERIKKKLKRRFFFLRTTS